jgi:hypothetical protein
MVAAKSISRPKSRKSRNVLPDARLPAILVNTDAAELTDFEAHAQLIAGRHHVSSAYARLVLQHLREGANG